MVWCLSVTKDPPTEFLPEGVGGEVSVNRDVSKCKGTAVVSREEWNPASSRATNEILPI